MKRHETIHAAMKRVVVPALRSRGFEGELSRMRRVTAGGTFTFQVSKWGGRFIIELGRAPAGPYVTMDGETVGPGMLTTWHLHGHIRNFAE